MLDTLNKCKAQFPHLATVSDSDLKKEILKHAYLPKVRISNNYNEKVRVPKRQIDEETPEFKKRKLEAVQRGLKSMEDTLREFLVEHSKMDENEINEEIEEICSSTYQKRTDMMKDWENSAGCKIPEYSQFLSPGDHLNMIVN